MNDEEAVKNYECFFGNGSEEEQLRIREIAQKIGIRDNDAIWLIVYVMNYFGRFYEALPLRIRECAAASMEDVKERCAAVADAEMDRIKEDLGAAVIERAEELAKQRGGYSVFLPVAWICAGVGVLCLACFTAGAAIAGKGWGRTPWDNLLGAPAGWILPIALLPLAAVSAFQVVTKYRNTRNKKGLLFLAGPVFVVILALLCFLRTL